jgi:hypothetical protein
MLLSMAVVAVLTGAAATMELLARAREEAVAARIDAMGPPLTVVPAGVRREAAERYDLGGALLPVDTQAAVAAVLGGSLRSAEGVLSSLEPVEGRQTPVVGIGPRGWPEGLPTDGVAVAGAELGRRLSSGAVVEVRGQALRVARVAPPTGSVDDAALLVPLAIAQRLLGVGAGGVNLLRLELRAGVKPAVAREMLERARLGATVLQHDRGAVAEGEAHATLAGHRAAVYVVLAALAIVGLLAAAHLDAAERRQELASLVALGASRVGVLTAVMARSGITSTVGACIGAAIGVAAAALQDAAVAGAWVRWWGVVPAAVVVAAGLGVMASTPVALACIARDPVRDLQGE